MRSTSPSAFLAATSERGFSGWGIALAALVLACAGVQAAFAQQSQAALERRRIALTERINTTSQLLRDSRRSRAATVAQLEGVQRQIDQREELLSVLALQIAHADSSVGRTDAVLTSMQADVDTLSAEYGRMARAALRQNLLNGRFSFLLSAESLGDAVQRVQYLRRYDAYRRRQLELIELTRQSLAGKVRRLDALRAAKQARYEEATEQGVLLKAELLEQRRLAEELSGDEARLRAELAEQNAAKDKLDGAIGAIIAEAAAASAERRAARPKVAAEAEAKPRVEAPTPPSSAADDYAEALADDFAKNRGRLPLPVARGFVSKPYGKRAHATLTKVQVNNNGVDIRTDAATEVRAVFEGEVVGLQDVPGYHTMVILQHGDYYTVYSNLVDVQVKPGARVGTAAVLGAVAAGETAGASELHFEVWRGRETMNPTRWVRGL